MNITPEATRQAYAKLTDRKVWRKPVPVYLTKRGQIIVGRAGTYVPESAALVCNYALPLPSYAEVAEDIEHEAQLMRAAYPSLSDRVLALVLESRRGVLTTTLADKLNARTPEVGAICEAHWHAGRIGRRREKPERGPWRELWVKQTDKAALRPVHLPTGPDAPARCAGRQPSRGAKVCALREECARYRALLDTWNDLPDAARQTTPVYSRLCAGGSTFHFLEIPDAAE